ncbi:response regulator transcription factor [Metabacillus niabensis]|uniref:response regulator n=1 Tax=Metabacillus niabensis TaxID=324854 RepID=UPI0011A9EA28
MIKILVVDDHPAVREGTKALLETEKDIQVDCYDSEFTTDAVKNIDFSPYDIILMDMNLGEHNGIELSKVILKKDKDAKIILYTGYEFEDYIEEALTIGIYGTISKTESNKKLLSYIKHAIDGEVVISQKFIQNILLESASRRDVGKSKKFFTDRELSILIEVDRGLTNQEIADKLQLSKRSIEYALTSIFSKLNVSSRTEAVLMAKAKGKFEIPN